MNTPELKSLKNEKRIFLLIISLLLFTLVYMSSYTLIVRDENEKFKREIESVNGEINLLMNLLPQKDTLISVQEKEILRQLRIIQKSLNDNKTTQQEKQALVQRLSALKMEALQLRQPEQITDEFIPQSTATQVATNRLDVEKERKLQASAQEIERLKAVIAHQQKRTPEIATSKALSTFYFMAYPSDIKNRHLKTNYVTLQLQFSGNATAIQCSYFTIEVRDPNNQIISSPSDRIRAVSDILTEYKFMPRTSQFKKGRYSVRVYCKETDFQMVTFFNLL